MLRHVPRAVIGRCLVVGQNNIKTAVGCSSSSSSKFATAAATPRWSFPAATQQHQQHHHHPPSYHQHSYLHAHWRRRRHRPPVRQTRPPTAARKRRNKRTSHLSLSSLSQLPSYLLQRHSNKHNAYYYYNDWIRFWNPWYSLAVVTTDDTLLSFKVESVTRTFGVVAALMCSLSAASLVVIPSASMDDDDDDEYEREAIATPVATTSDSEIISDMEASPTTTARTTTAKTTTTTRSASTHVSKSSLLVHWVGLSPKTTHDWYTASCAGAFYSSVCAMGLSAVINAWLAATPVGCTRQFVQYHSWMICSIPGFLAISTGLAGVSLFIGLDRAKGTPISYIGLGGTVLGGVIIGSATVRGMMATYRFLTPLVRAIK